MAKYKQVLATWSDLPAYVYKDSYLIALMQWVSEAIKSGRKNVETLVISALDHEADNKEPYFYFPRNEEELPGNSAIVMKLADPTATLAYLREQLDRETDIRLYNSANWLMSKPRKGCAKEWENAGQACKILRELIGVINNKATLKESGRLGSLQDGGCNKTWK